MKKKLISKIRLIRHYYTDNLQVLKLIEELAELQKELCKYLIKESNINSVIEETADVEIMLEQLKDMLVIKPRVVQMIDYKVHRTLNAINEEQTIKK